MVRCLTTSTSAPCLMEGCPYAAAWLDFPLGAALALRATFRRDSPPKNPQADPFQTPSKLGHPNYPTSSASLAQALQNLAPHSGLPGLALPNCLPFKRPNSCTVLALCAHCAKGTPLERPWKQSWLRCLVFDNLHGPLCPHELTMSSFLLEPVDEEES